MLQYLITTSKTGLGGCGDIMKAGVSHTKGTAHFFVPCVKNAASKPRNAKVLE